MLRHFFAWIAIFVLPLCDEISGNDFFFALIKDEYNVSNHWAHEVMMFGLMQITFLTFGGVPWYIELL